MFLMHVSFMIQIVVFSTNCVMGGSQTKIGFMGKLDNSFGLNDQKEVCGPNLGNTMVHLCYCVWFKVM